MHKTLICAAAAAASLMMSAAAHADQYAGPGFSGIAYTADRGGQSRRLGSIYVDRSGFRMTIENGGQSFGSLIRWGDPVAYSLMLDERMYIKVPPAEIGFDNYEARPCLYYKGARQIGTETVDGRITEKWRCTGELSTAEGELPANATTWYDPELAFEIKTARDDGSEFEIREISVGRQNPKLFEIPAGFKELDMNAVIESLQQ